MTKAHILGFPRIGARRELKFALERFWQGALDQAELAALGRELRRRHWSLQRSAGLDYATAGDFAWYDHVLWALACLGLIPRRFGYAAERLTLAQYFSLARGDGREPAMELTKWFDTNYHYLVPEWDDATRAAAGVEWLFEEVREAQADGHAVKVAIVGPLTLLHLGKYRAGPDRRLELLPEIVAAYARLLARLKALGVAWVQMDEPALCTDLPRAWLDAFPPVYDALAPAAPPILLATYFGPVAEHAPLLKSLPVAGLHLDLVRGGGQLDAFLPDYPPSKVLSLGMVNGRNVWRTDLAAALDVLELVQEQLGPRLWVGTSCSLLHVPMDCASEDNLENGLADCLAFAVQKLDEIAALKRGLTQGRGAVADALAASRKARERLHSLARRRSAEMQRRFFAVTDRDCSRSSPFHARIGRQRDRLRLPPLPTTTIGSFPQTAEIRRSRAAWRRGTLDDSRYAATMRGEIALAVRRQLELGLDVLVHGEPERNDMVEYFAEQLEGFAVTRHGWVQSYGSRCVKPPILYGHVRRSKAMTVQWISYAQQLSPKPVKGMLTGPLTMLQWSFTREDMPRETIAFEIALALREEVLDLERSGIAIIQIDEPAFREGLPLRRSEWPHYFAWAVRAFRLVASGVADETQIHTHMCYSEFNDILPAIAELDADVITIEAARSGMELLDVFAASRYENDIGPGIYDVHSPRVPTVQEMTHLLERAARVLPIERLWVNPDCGLKTREWPEVEAALANMVSAAHAMRDRAG